MVRSSVVSVAVVFSAIAISLASAQGQAAETVPAEAPSGSAALAASPPHELTPGMRRMAWLACRVRHPDAPYLLCDAPIYTVQPPPLPGRRDGLVEPQATDSPTGSAAPQRTHE